MYRRGYFTVITKSYLAQARVLMAKLKALDPAAERMVFLADRIDDCFDPLLEPFTVITPEKFLSDGERLRMSFQYNAFELCNACKGFAHRYIDRSTEWNSWMYFDSDVIISHSPEPLFHESPDACILLTIHALKPVPIDIINPLETTFLRCGIYNGGWICLRRSEQASRFIEWLTSRLLGFCFEEEFGTFVDQLWLNLVPLYFDSVAIVRCPGANIAYWNLHERKLKVLESGELMCNDEPVYFLHMSGWDPYNRAVVTKHPGEYQASAEWIAVATEYAKDLFASGFAETRSWPYSWAKFENGEPISIGARRKFYADYVAGRWPRGLNPFTTPRATRIPPKPSWLRRAASRLLRSTIVRRRLTRPA